MPGKDHGCPRLLAGSFTVLLLAAALPVFSVTIPPLIDYPNHLARMQVITEAGSDPVLARFYGVQWHILPNLVMEAIVPLLAGPLGIFPAGQVFIFVTLALIASGVAALHLAVHRRVSVWPIAIFLFLYNYVFLYGFMNYMFGVGVALWGTAAWVGLRERPRWLRVLVSSLFVLVLFFCHLFALGLYGFVLLCYEAWFLTSRDTAAQRRPVADMAVFAPPFLPAVPLMLDSPAAGHAGDVTWVFPLKWDGLAFILQTCTPLLDWAAGAVIAAAALAMIVTRRLHCHRVGWSILVLGTLLYLAMPQELFGSWVADGRLPVVLLFFLLGFLRLDLQGTAARAGFVAFVLAVALARYAGVAEAWLRLDRVYTDLRQSMQLIEPGSKVLTAIADDPLGEPELNQALGHAPNLAVIERSAFVATTFADPGKQILTVAPEYQRIADLTDIGFPYIGLLGELADDPAPEGDEYWVRWEKHYDYLYLLYDQPNVNPYPHLMTLIYQGDGFQLFRIGQTPPGVPVS